MVARRQVQTSGGESGGCSRRVANPIGLGPLGVFIAVPVSFSLFAAWAAVLFRGGKWKTKKV